MIRKLKDDDIPILKDFCRGLGFGLPDVHSPLVLVSGVYENNGKVVGYGQVKIANEVFVVIDPNEENKTKLKAIQDLFVVGREMSRKIGIESWLAFVKSNQGFERTIMKWFGFKKVNEDCLELKLD